MLDRSRYLISGDDVPSTHLQTLAVGGGLRPANATGVTSGVTKHSTARGLKLASWRSSSGSSLLLSAIETMDPRVFILSKRPLLTRLIGLEVIDRLDGDASNVIPGGKL